MLLLTAFFKKKTRETGLTKIRILGNYYYGFILFLFLARIS